jgi:nitrite reductase/ring-hydroxylating ferredoxin subunit
MSSETASWNITNKHAGKFRIRDQAKRPGPSVQEILDSDSRTVPPSLREERNDYLWEGENIQIDKDRYLSHDFHRLECERMWNRTWQVACRVEEIPRVGDHIVYEIAGKSLIVVRSSPTEIKALHNVCLHRGRILREEDGHVENFRCRFHGFAWQLDGKLCSVPCRWDFPDLKDEEFSLPEARVGVWGGFVFINLAPDGISLEEQLGNIPDHYRQWNFEDRYIAAHVGIVVKANWKVVLEASLEAMHIAATHPQALPFMCDVNAQYDASRELPHNSRLISPLGLPSPFLAGQVTPQQTLDEMGFPGVRGTQLPPNTTPRKYAAELIREQMKSAIGRDFSNVSDSEILDLIIYFNFPNLYLQGGYLSNNTLFYRHRPWNDDPGQCLWEIYLLLPTPKNSPTPPPAPLHMLKPGQTLLDAPELGPFLSPFLNQDLSNMEWVQKGLRAATRPVPNLSRYQESQIRHFHRTLDMYLYGEDPQKRA